MNKNKISIILVFCLLFTFCFTSDCFVFKEKGQLMSKEKKIEKKKRSGEKKEDDDDDDDEDEVDIFYFLGSTMNTSSSSSSLLMLSYLGAFAHVHSSSRRPHISQHEQSNRPQTSQRVGGGVRFLFVFFFNGHFPRQRRLQHSIGTL